MIMLVTVKLYLGSIPHNLSPSVCVLLTMLVTIKLSIVSILLYISFCVLLQMIQYSMVQYSTVQYSTVRYSTVQYGTVRYSTVQYLEP